MNSKEKTKYRRSKKWAAFRWFMLNKYQHLCYMCNIEKRGKKTRYLQIHHINEDSYGNEKEEDCVLLCSRDHKLLEQLLRRKNFDIDDYCAKLKDLYNRSK